jgi:hypothetical protein
MAIQISKELEDALYGDEAVMKYLEICREGFIAGNKTCLFEIIEIRAQHQAVIPGWAADEILKIRGLIEDGEVKGFDEVFDFKAENQATRKRKARLKKYKNEVLGLMQSYRVGKTDNSLTADDILQTVAEDLKISRRDVEDIYRSSGSFIKAIPKGNPENIIYGFAHSEMPPYRRQGRAILKD